MPRQIETHYFDEYSSNVSLLLQQRGSKLMDCVEMGSHEGENASPTEQVGPIVAHDNATPNARLALDETPADKRWVTPQDFWVNPHLNNLDKLRQKVSLEDSFVRNAAMALGRKQDDIIIGAFDGVAQTGRQHEVRTPLPATQSIANGGEGATDAKIIRGMEILQEAEVDTEMEMVYFGITPRQNRDLLAYETLTSKDYTTEKPVLVNGKVKEFCGAYMKQMTRFKKTGNIRRNPLWVKSGMYYGSWDNINTEVSKRNDLQGHPWQFYTTGSGDATRLEEKRVVMIECSEA